MAKKNFDRILDMDPAKVLEEVQAAGNPGLAARMVSERLVDAPTSDGLSPLKLVSSGRRDDPSIVTQPMPAAVADPPPAHSSYPQTMLGPGIQGSRGIVTRASGKKVARLFCYVEPELYRDVRMYCVQHDVSISDLVNGVLVDALRRKIRD
jgi:hypothetical protein